MTTNTPEGGDRSQILRTKVTVDCGVQCNLLQPANEQLSHAKLEENTEMLKYYTSFENYGHFSLFFTALGPAATSLRKFSSIPDARDQLLLTLMKLRIAKDDIELAYIFRISRRTVGQVFSCWLNFMYFQLKELNLWPTGDVVQQHMPRSFGRTFPNTKLILDATEIPVEKPENANAQSMTFSTYKNRNTLKTMVGCTPRGAVVYVSDTYGGSTSDRQIMERSELLTNLEFQKDDSIMADRGIMVQDLFAAKNVKVNTPHMLKGKHQLTATELVQDRRIASKRIHVERVIGLCKTFKILKKDLNANRLLSGQRIVFVCFMINNFRQCIVGNNA